MDRYTKAFVVASLVYLVLAAALGLWMGAGDAPGWARFAHVHFNLLGFMAMMVYGVGYFILPRFNARELRWPSWIPVHFYLANIGLLGLVATYSTMPSTAFALFGLLSLLAVALFATNLCVTMLAAGPEEAIAEPEPRPRIDPDMRVGEILTRWPHLVETFVASGFPSLGDPAHQEQVKQMPITLRMACQRHGVDVAAMAARLEEQAAIGAVDGRPAGGSSIDGPVRADHVLGDILAAHPGTEEVFRKYYGSGCFSCPGQATETVRQSAMMHSVDMQALLQELNAAARRGSGGRK